MQATVLVFGSTTSQHDTSSKSHDPTSNEDCNVEIALSHIAVPSDCWEIWFDSV